MPDTIKGSMIVIRPHPSLIIANFRSKTSHVVTDQINEDPEVILGKGNIMF